MVFENIGLPEISLASLFKAILLVTLGIVLGVFTKFVIKKFASITIYPWVRKSAPGSYKKTVYSVGLISNIIQWFIIILFVLQALSVFDIFVLNEITRLGINFVPKLATALLIIAIGLIVTSILSRKIRDMEFKNSTIVAKVFEVIFISATILSALEAVDVKVTAFLEIFRAGIYAIALTFAIAVGIAVGLILKPEIARLVKDLKK